MRLFLIFSLLVATVFANESGGDIGKKILKVTSKDQKKAMKVKTLPIVKPKGNGKGVKKEILRKSFKVYKSSSIQSA